MSNDRINDNYTNLIDESLNRSEFRRKMNETPFTEHKKKPNQNGSNDSLSDCSSFLRPTNEKNVLRDIPYNSMNILSTAVKPRKIKKIMESPQKKEIGYKMIELFNSEASKTKTPINVKCFMEDEMDVDSTFLNKMHRNVHHDDDMDTDEESYDRSVAFCVHQQREGIIEELKDTGQIPRGDSRTLTEIMKWQKENGIPHDLNLKNNMNRQKQLGKVPKDSQDESETKLMQVTRAISSPTSFDLSNEASSNKYRGYLEYNHLNSNYTESGTIQSKSKVDFSLNSFDQRFANITDSLNIARNKQI